MQNILIFLFLFIKIYNFGRNHIAIYTQLYLCPKDGIVSWETHKQWANTQNCFYVRNEVAHEGNYRQPLTPCPLQVRLPNRKPLICWGDGYSHGSLHLIVLILGAFDRNLGFLKILFLPPQFLVHPLMLWELVFGKNSWVGSSFTLSNPFYKVFVVFSKKILHLYACEKPKAVLIPYTV